MKPLRVKMSAFGSYRDEVEIDFRKIDHGIFLITGDTGAGKTTIFDAITYALYDHSSTDIKSGSMMRSQYASEAAPTYVELEFEDRGSCYRIVRNPAYTREQKRKGKDGSVLTTMESPKVSLYLPDGTLFSGKVKETNEKIVEIVGLNAEQFRQTVMLAQGEFLQLLLASSRQRKEIFSRLFDTNFYGVIQEKLRNRAKALETELSQLQRAWEQQSAGLEPQLREGLLTAKSAVTMEHALEQLSQRILEDREGEKALGLQKAQKESLLIQLREKLQKIQQEIKLLDRLEEAAKALKEIQTQADAAALRQNHVQLAKKAELVHRREQQLLDAKRRLDFNGAQQKSAAAAIMKQEKQCETLQKLSDETLQQWQEAQPGLQKELIELERSLPEYRQLQQGRLALMDLEKQLAEKTRSLQESIGQGQQLMEQKAHLQERQEKLSEAGIRQSKLEAELARKEDRVSRMRELTGQFESIKQLYQDMKTKDNMAGESKKQLDILTRRYEEQYRRFLSEQAGLLAKQLIKGKPCPVCGATSHPAPNQGAGDAPSQEQVEQDRLNREQAGEKHEKLQEACTQAKERYRSGCQTTTELGRQLVGADFSLNQEQVDQARRICEAEAAAAAELRRALRQAGQEYAQWKAGEETRKEMEASLEQNRKKQEQLQEAYHALSSQRALLEQTVHRLEQQLLFPDEKQALARKSQLEQQLRDLKKRCEETEQQLRQARESLQKLQGQRQSLQEEQVRLGSEQKAAQELFIQERMAQGFAEEASYRSALLSLQEIQKLEQWCKWYEEALQQRQTAVQVLEEQTAGMKRQDIAPVEAALQTAKEARDQIEQQEKQLYLRLNQEEKAEAMLKRILAERKKKEEQYAIASRLDKTANGRLAKTAGLDFQTYMQRQYFQQIIRQANRRMTEMTGGEYLLRCREIQDLSRQGEVGLDLDVYSTITGKQRDVKTLSGGESFMASLSMALGMADMIRSVAGRIHMDMMFIDEGFGTLDEQARSQAIRILCQLAGDRRLIGIISHVNQLKEQIDRKLVVTKGKQGSSICWELD